MNKNNIISRKDYIERTVAIAKGEYKPAKDGPKTWYESGKAKQERGYDGINKPRKDHDT